MIGFRLFDDLAGISLNDSDMRAMSAEELDRLQMANAAATQQATFGAEHYRRMMNWFPLGNMLEAKPLDERFADFKIRLAAAVARLASPSDQPKPPPHK